MDRPEARRGQRGKDLRVLSHALGDAFAAAGQAGVDELPHVAAVLICAARAALLAPIAAAGIIAAIEHGLSNARVEAINTQIRMITRRAYGFHSPGALIALAMLSLAGLWPPLPR